MTDEGLFPVEKNLKKLWRELPLPREGEDLDKPCVLCGARSYYTFEGIDPPDALACTLDDQGRRRFRIHREPHDRGKHVPEAPAAPELTPPSRAGGYDEEDA